MLAALWDQCEVAVGRDALSWVLALGSSAAGVLIALRRPRNAIGWILLAAAVSVGEDSLARAYADHWVAGNGGPATLGKAAAVYGDQAWVGFLAVPVTFLPSCLHLGLIGRCGGSRQDGAVSR